MYFKIEPSKDPQQPWYIKIYGDNNEVIMTSETYHHLQHAKNIIDKIKVQAPMAEVKIAQK